MKFSSRADIHLHLQFYVTVEALSESIKKIIVSHCHGMGSTPM